MAAGRYLILRLSALGDVVFALEALAALRAAEPDARIDWVVEDRVAAVLDGHAAIERRITFPRRTFVRDLRRPWRWPAGLRSIFRYVHLLRGTRYDAVLDLHGNFKSALHVALVRARRKIGFAAPRARDLSWLAVRERVTLPAPGMHRAEQGLLLIAQLLGQDVPAARASGPLLVPSADAEARALAFLEAHGLADGAPVIALAPGTSAFAAFKRWPAERFRDLARLLHADGHRVVVCTGPGEEQLAAALRADRPPTPWFDGAEHGLPVLLALLRHCAAVVAADSGPLHLAQAVGTPVVGLFGPKDPAVYGPRRPGSIVLRYPVPCAPCGRRRCDAPICVQGISPQDVHEAVNRLAANRT